MKFYEKYNIITNKIESVCEEEEKEFVMKIKLLKELNTPINL